MRELLTKSLSILVASRIADAAHRNLAEIQRLSGRSEIGEPDLIRSTTLADVPSWKTPPLAVYNDIRSIEISVGLTTRGSC